MRRIKDPVRSADTAGVITPGWYDDGTTPNAVRWYDGLAWTEHVRAVPAPVATPAYQSAAAPGTQWAAPQWDAQPPAQQWTAQPAAQPPAQQWTAPPAAQPPAQHWAAPQTAQPWAAQPGSQWAAQPSNGPSDAMHWILPVGRSWQSITAGYLGLFGLVIWPLAPFALWLGIWAMRIPGGHGRGRAVFAIITGALGTAFGALALLSWM